MTHPPSEISPDDDGALLAHETQQNPSMWRRIAILQVLAQRGFTPWPELVAAVENVLEPGIFGESPRTRLARDLRLLRASGVAIAYSRVRGAEGYYLRADALGELAASAVEVAVRGVDPVRASSLALESEINGRSPEQAVLDLLAESENAARAEPLHVVVALVAALGSTLDLTAITSSAAEAGLGGLWAGLLDAIWHARRKRGGRHH
ncbi:MAG: hypothetical protein GX613_14380 [Chloroflexi bacterium]|nr:hypothetical protein [Chloroflexota bacterium]